MGKIFGVVLAIGHVVLLIGCSSLQKQLSADEQAVIENAGGKSVALQNMLAYQNNEKIDAILVFKDDHLVLERYVNGYNSNTPHDIRSATKAITSVLVGIAIDKGLIAGESQRILDYFPEKEAGHPEFRDLRIKDLLTMSSGLDSDDWIPSSVGNEERMYSSHSWIDFFFSLPVVDKPGTRFRYSTAGVIVLGEIVKRASGLELEKFADQYLFRDLGIVNYKYAKTPAGETDAGGHLRLLPRDFAKIGILVMEKGKWKGKQLVSEGWLDKMNHPEFLIPGVPTSGPYMGYLWWQEPVVEGEVRSFQARGNGGQYLIAVPSEGVLGVFTGSAFNDNQQLQPFLLMKNFVIPAFRN